MQTKIMPAESKRFYSSLAFLRMSVGIVYLWFGALKYFQGVSPAEFMAIQTIHRLTFGVIPDQASIIMLATWECAIGFLFIIGKFTKQCLVLMLLHMVCTFTPIFFFPDEIFFKIPFQLTLTGQYIIKNIVFISAGIVLWNTEKLKEKQQEYPVVNPAQGSTKIIELAKQAEVVK